MIASRPVRLLALLGALPIAAACGGGGSSPSTSSKAAAAELSATVPVRGQHIVVTVPSWAQVPKALLAKFTARTGVSVTMNVTGFDSIRDKIVIANAGGKSLGDITEFDWSWTGQFGPAGWYTPLDGMLDAATSADLLNKGAFTAKGHQYAVCYSNDFRISAYNKAHLAQAGITAPPKTLDEALADARILKQKGVSKHPLALSLAAVEGTATEWYLLTLAEGGQLFDSHYKPLFAGAGSPGAKALQFLVTAVKEGLTSPGALSPNAVADDELYSGKASIIIPGGPGEVESANDPKQSKIVGKAAYMLVPGANGPGKTFGLPEGLGITAHSQHKAAAAAFLRWWLEPATQLALQKSIQLLPCRASAVQTLVKNGTLPGGAMITQQLKTLTPLFPQGAPPWYNRFSSEVGNQINAAAKGDETVAEALAALSEKARALASGG